MHIIIHFIALSFIHQQIKNEKTLRYIGFGSLDEEGLSWYIAMRTARMTMPRETATNRTLLARTIAISTPIVCARPRTWLCKGIHTGASTIVTNRGTAIFFVRRTAIWEISITALIKHCPIDLMHQYIVCPIGLCGGKKTILPHSFKFVGTRTITAIGTIGIICFCLFPCNKPQKPHTQKNRPAENPSGDNIIENMKGAFYSASSEVSLQLEAFQLPLRFDHCSAFSSLTPRLLVAIMCSVWKPITMDEGQIYAFFIACVVFKGLRWLNDKGRGGAEAIIW